MSSPNGNPLHQQFREVTDFLHDHPPPPQMLWILVETLKNTADVVSVLEQRRAEEFRPAQVPLDLPFDDQP